MKSFLAATLALFLLVFNTRATTHFVDVNSTNPVSPYADWSTAATNIQDAIDAAAPSDTVLVTNGVYQYGGDSFNGSNRVDISGGVILQSMNGPALTTIKGYQVPGATNGPSAVRCAYLREFAQLRGFTLTGGATAASGSGLVVSGGGFATDSSCVISNCVIVENASYGNGGGAWINNGTAMSNCVVAGNFSYNGFGGGVYGGVNAALVNCMISNNFAGAGGGVGSCTIYSSLLVGNTAGSGGAAYLSTLNNCTLTGNHSSTLGAADSCKLQNSIIYYNSNGSYADCYMCQLSNCCTTIGLGTSSLPTNCISNAPGFVNAAAGDYHLNPWSPCVDAGNNAFTSNSLDLDGDPRVVGTAVDMGAFETQSPLQVTAHYVSLLSTNPVSPYTNWSTAATNIQQAVGVAQEGEFVIAADGTYSIGSTLITGSENNRVALTNPVTLVSAGGPQGAIISGGTGMRCIYVGTNATLMGFTLTNGHTFASGNITNDESGGGAWCASGAVVSNCIAVGNFAGPSAGLGGGIFGGTIWNCVLTNNNAYEGSGAAVASLNNCLVISNGWGPGYTGYGGGLYAGVASNCTFTANWGYFGGGGAALSTLYNCALSTNGSGSTGASTFQAGGAYSSHLYHCMVSGNYGDTGGAAYCTNYSCIFSGNRGLNYGGGAFFGISYNCIFTGNGAVAGGGDYSCKLLHCVVVGNTATNSGGGCNNSTAFPVYNSIVYYNTCLNAPSSSNQTGDTMANCCTTPVDVGIPTCFTNEPLLVNWQAGDFHLQSNSPCINSGNNVFDTNSVSIFFAVLTNDFDGNPRLIGSAPDVGAYEYPTPASILPYSWLWKYGLATDGSADSADSDGDGLSNYAEWRAGTNPTNAASVLILQTPVLTDTNATIVTWQSASGIRYYVQSTPDLLAQPFQSIASNILSGGASTSYVDTNAVNGGATSNATLFYRVGVQ